MSSRREATRAAVIEAAGRAWLAHGFNGVGLERIAEMAGVTRRTVYLHFAGKAELLLAYVHDAEVRAGLPPLVGALSQAATGTEAIERLGDIQVEYVPKIYPAIRLMHAARLQEPAAETVWNDRMRARRTAFRTVAEGMRERGELAADLTVSDAVMLIWVLTSPHMYEYLVADGGWSPSRYRANVVRLLRLGLLQQQALQPSGGDRQSEDAD